MAKEKNNVIAHLEEEFELEITRRDDEIIKSQNDSKEETIYNCYKFRIRTGSNQDRKGKILSFLAKNKIEYTLVPFGGSQGYSITFRLNESKPIKKLVIVNAEDAKPLKEEKTNTKAIAKAEKTAKKAAKDNAAKQGKKEEKSNGEENDKKDQNSQSVDTMSGDVNNQSQQQQTSEPNQQSVSQ